MGVSQDREDDQQELIAARSARRQVNQEASSPHKGWGPFYFSGGKHGAGYVLLHSFSAWVGASVGFHNGHVDCPIRGPR